MLYRNALPLTFARHGALKLRAPLDFHFARSLQAVPIGLSELPLAAQWYPIAFSDGEDCRPLALLGFRPGENLFVDEGGEWQSGAYVPAVVRRFPFLLTSVEGKDVLLIETTPEILSEIEDGIPLFEGKAPSAMTRSAMRLCRGMAADEAGTAGFVAALKDLDLLESRTATVELSGGRRLSVSGFLTIDEGRFRALSDGVFLDLRRRGWLASIYAQIHSTLNWSRLADRVGARAA
ncbi:SapC family protein [Phenylobacterium sp.]|uniref:SapC family protein n=1 Tax=Phenylobacterium sp. TaxID=1871053 RepID=UPI0035C7E405